jgi:hypothetical protein
MYSHFNMQNKKNMGNINRQCLEKIILPNQKLCPEKDKCFYYITY